MKPTIDPTNLIPEETAQAFEILPVVDVMSTDPTFDFSYLFKDPKTWFLLVVVVLVIKLLTYTSKKKGE